MILLKSTEIVIPFLMVDATDDETAETGLSPAVQISKNGGAFANTTNSASEIGNGWYKVTITTTETNTEGPLIVRATAAGADAWRDYFMVIDPTDFQAVITSLATAANLATVDTVVDAIKAKTDNLPASPAATGDIPAASAIADAVWDEALAGHTGAGSTGAQLGDVALSDDIPAVPSAASIADAVWDEDITGHSAADSAGEALAASGGGVTAAAIADAVWDEAVADHDDAGSAGAALSAAGAAGIAAGAVEFTYTVEDEAEDPIDGAEVWITTDAAGSHLIWYGTTDALGVARSAAGGKPFLDPGTFYAWTKKAGYSFSNPDALTVTAP